MAREISPPISMDELRAAFDRARTLRFYGWTFQKALAVPTLLKTLQLSAAARRARHSLPAQPRLF